jgi:hypothetical protein
MQYLLPSDFPELADPAEEILIPIQSPFVQLAATPVTDGDPESAAADE